jgi:tRNA-dihydrouridine synthase
MLEYTKCDAVMIGRAALGNPWIFREIKHYMQTGQHLPPPTVNERVDTAIEHLRTAISWKGSQLGIIETRRHYGTYFKGFADIKPYRMRLVTSYSETEIFDTLEEIREVYQHQIISV